MLLDLEDKTPSEFFQTSINVFKQKNINEKIREKNPKTFPKNAPKKNLNVFFVPKIFYFIFFFKIMKNRIRK